ncbi:SCO family protein [Desulfobacterota bacterium AH_259_B03_O07]|nr:SCO family protein [Desulfobacterota bacterium AH_259_B03_O07]
MKKTFVITISLLFLIIILWGFFLFKYFELERQNRFHGTIFEKEAPEFTLIGHNQSEINLSQFRGKIILISFGYTNCPDICPTTLSTLKNVMNELGDLQELVQVLFITVDPERDTISRLKEYISYFHDSFIGLTGKPEVINEIAKSYNAYYFKEDLDSSNDYLMSHTSSVFLIDNDGRLLLRYSQDKLDSKSIAEDIKKIF